MLLVWVLHITIMTTSLQRTLSTSVAEVLPVDCGAAHAGQRVLCRRAAPPYPSVSHDVSVQTPRESIGCPIVFSPLEVVREALHMAKLVDGDVLIDLGCGDGRVIFEGVKRAAIRASKASQPAGQRAFPRVVVLMHARACVLT